jgi:hypothetical protein
VSRYSLGDLMVFRTNQPVAPGAELCISYLPHDLLAERDDVRQAAFDDQRKGFGVAANDGGGGEDDGGDDGEGSDDGDEGAASATSRRPRPPRPLRPVATAELQAALVALPPRRRLAELAYIRESDVALLRSDRKELAVLRALAHAQVGE